MALPSSDHVASRSKPDHAVSCFGSPPSTLTVQISGLPERSEPKARVFPSGDHATLWIVEDPATSCQGLPAGDGAAWTFGNFW